MTKNIIFNVVLVVFCMTTMVNETHAARIEEPLVAAQKAIRFGHWSKLERLMAAPTWKESGALLNFVAGQGNLNMVKKLLARDDVDVNQVFDDETALLRVFASKATPEIIEAIVVVLLNAGADIDAQSKIGDTALHRALRMNKRTIATMLIKAGANLSIKNNGGETPFHFILTRYSVKAIRHLMEDVGIRFDIFGDDDDNNMYHRLKTAFYRMADGERKNEFSSRLAHVTFCALLQNRRLEQLQALLSTACANDVLPEDAQDAIVGYVGADIPRDERYEKMMFSSMLLLAVQRLAKDVLAPFIKYYFSLSAKNRFLLEQLQTII